MPSFSQRHRARDDVHGFHKANLADLPLFVALLCECAKGWVHRTDEWDGFHLGWLVKCLRSAFCVAASFFRFSFENGRGEPWLDF